MPGISVDQEESDAPTKVFYMDDTNYGTKKSTPPTVPWNLPVDGLCIGVNRVNNTTCGMCVFHRIPSEQAFRGRRYMFARIDGIGDLRGFLPIQLKKGRLYDRLL